MVTEIIHEEWRPVVGLEGWYEVSSLGRLRRIKPSKIGCGIISGWVNRAGYHFADFGRDGVKIKMPLHRAVCRAFNGEPPEGKPFVNHKDGDTHNNAAWNLEWCSKKENMQHAIYTLNRVWGRSTIEPHTAVEIYKECCKPNRRSYSAIGHQFGVTAVLVGTIARGESWARFTKAPRAN